MQSDWTLNHLLLLPPFFPSFSSENILLFLLYILFLSPFIYILKSYQKCHLNCEYFHVQSRSSRSGCPIYLYGEGAALESAGHCVTFHPIPSCPPPTFVTCACCSSLRFSCSRPTQADLPVLMSDSSVWPLWLVQPFLGNQPRLRIADVFLLCSLPFQLFYSTSIQHLPQCLASNQ